MPHPSFEGSSRTSLLESSSDCPSLTVEAHVSQGPMVLISIRVQLGKQPTPDNLEQIISYRELVTKALEEVKERPRKGEATLRLANEGAATSLRDARIMEEAMLLDRKGWSCPTGVETLVGLLCGS